MTVFCKLKFLWLCSLVNAMLWSWRKIHVNSARRLNLIVWNKRVFVKRSHVKCKSACPVGQHSKAVAGITLKVLRHVSSQLKVWLREINSTFVNRSYEKWKLACRLCHTTELLKAVRIGGQFNSAPLQLWRSNSPISICQLEFANLRLTCERACEV